VPKSQVVRFAMLWTGSMMDDFDINVELYMKLR
jgi:hypothetical protein